MKIVHCFFTFEMGGAQVLTVDLLNKMCEEHETTLIIVNNVCSEALLQKLDKRVALYRINRKEGSRDPRPLLKFNVLLFKLKPDIIHCHEYNIGKIIKARVGKRIYTIHDVGLATTFYHHFDALVAISDAVLQDAAARLQRPITVIYNGVDASPFKKRTDYLAKDQAIKLVQLSRLMHEKKGQEILIQALAHIKREKGFSDFKLDLVGEGASKHYLEQLVKDLDLQNEISFAGERNRDWLFNNLKDYHLLVQPSHYEGFGLTILEGFAAGLPVLASDIEGPAEIISRTPRGFLFKKGDSQDCAEKLYKLFLDYQEGSIAEVMQNSKPVTDTEYSITTCVAGYLQEYNQLLKKQ